MTTTAPTRTAAGRFQKKEPDVAVDPATGEVLSAQDETLPGTDVPSTIEQLPLFDGLRVYRLEVALGGSVDLALLDADARAILDDLKLTDGVTVTLHIGERRIDLDAMVTARTYKRKKTPLGAMQTVTVAKITVDDDDAEVAAL